MVLFEELLEASKQAVQLSRVPVNVPEWEPVLKGRKLYLQKMSTDDRDAWEAEGLERNGDKYEVKTHNVRARLVSKCLVDEEGIKVFPNADTLKPMASTIVLPLYEKAEKLNKISRAAVDDLAKNS